MLKPSWVGVDWGTSNLRAYALNSNNEVLEVFNSSKGMGGLQSDQFEAALVELIEPWLTTGEIMPVFACGMVGARQGWKEAHYREVPCKPVCQRGLTKVNTKDLRINVQILPGLSQLAPAGVMRGEETQIAGLLVKDPNFQGVICLPGTHSKWVDVTDGYVMNFKTFMTGEMFAVISEHTVLRHSMSTAVNDSAAFIASALEAVSNPNEVAPNLFGLRANDLLHGTSPEITRSRLSGMLVGQEIGCTRDLWSNKPVTLVGASQMTHLYASVLNKLNVEVTIIDAARATIMGLSIAAK